MRFAACPSELRSALAQKFGDNAILSTWRDGAMEDEPRSWCQRRAEEWASGTAAELHTRAAPSAKTGSAWSRRRAKKKVVAVGAAEGQETGT